jgi:transcriptional regulator with AAA-type ATPase domain
MTGGESTSTGDVDAGAPEDERAVDIPRLMVALSFHRPFVPGMRISMGSAHEVLVGRGPSRAVEHEGRRTLLTLEDRLLSRRHFAVRRLATGWEVEDLGSKNGTLLNGERRLRAILDDGDVIEAGSTILLFREEGFGRQNQVHECCDRDLAGEREWSLPAVLRTLSLDLERRFSELVRISKSSVPVLLRGESGVGKELIAYLVHELSGRSGAFVPINCGALPRTLIESELFGHRRGSFSDARQDRDGLVREAAGGTLFLDEIAELPAESQAALLRFLQGGEVRPVGANEVYTVDVRVVAATNQDLGKRIAFGSFRQDLYARLAGFRLELPSLRQRREDLGTLIATILPGLGRSASNITLHRQAARALFNYPYPLNVRELEQALRAAVVLADGKQIRLEHLPAAIRDHRPAADDLRPSDPVLRARLHDVLAETSGNVSAAARTLNKAPNQIRRWCERFEIDLESFRGLRTVGQQAPTVRRDRVTTGNAVGGSPAQHTNKESQWRSRRKKVE